MNCFILAWYIHMMASYIAYTHPNEFDILRRPNPCKFVNFYSRLHRYMFLTYYVSLCKYFIILPLTFHSISCRTFSVHCVQCCIFNSISVRIRIYFCPFSPICYPVNKVSGRLVLISSCVFRWTRISSECCRDYFT